MDFVDDLALHPASARNPQAGEADTGADRVAATRRELCEDEAALHAGADPAAGPARRYLGEHPWQLVGAGVVLGAAAAALVLWRSRARAMGRG